MKRYAQSFYRHLNELGPINGMEVTLSKAFERLLMRVGKSWNFGRNQLNADFDVLVILDACRNDLFEEFAPKHPLYDQFKSVGSVYSCASSSREWIQKVYGTASQTKLANIHLVSGNGWETKEVDLSSFGNVTPVWERHDSELGTIPPQEVTDAAINAGRTTNCQRLVVHYMQPHAPFLHTTGKYNSVNATPGEGQSQNVWEGLRKGEFSKDEVWTDYGRNLLAVLDQVERLVKNVDGSVVITADHANAVGELGVYGHPDYVCLPALKYVPWVRLDATDMRSYEPEDPITSSANERDLENHLRDLGYKL